MRKSRLEEALSKIWSHRLGSLVQTLIKFSQVIFNKICLSTYALPIARKAVEEYLKLDTVQVTSGLASWDGTKVSHLGFSCASCTLLRSNIKKSM